MFSKFFQRKASESISRSRCLECPIDRKILIYDASHSSTCPPLAVTTIPLRGSSAVYTTVAAPLVGGGCHSVSTTAPSDDDTVERERG